MLNSNQIAQTMAAQNSMFSGQIALSQQLAYPRMAAMNPGMPPPAPASFSGEFDYQRRIESGIMGASSFAGNVGAPMLTTGLTLAGSLGALGPMGRIFDPFAMGKLGFRAFGGGAMGLAGGLGVAAASMLPALALGKVVETYVGSALGGMQDQFGVNQMLRNNFNFVGGGGFMGRGFSVGQMNQIGGMMYNIARQDPFTNMSELTQLTAMGNQMGMFIGVRDVQAFSKKFKEMLATLKTVQQELGGSLQDALNFVQQAKASGIYNPIDRGLFASVVRRTADIAGVSQSTVLQMTQYGSQLSRSLGGTGAQGAIGASRALQQVGAAMNLGVMSQSMLAEATGGLDGEQGMMAFSQNLMERAARMTRTGYGRYSIFALSNREGTGIDSNAMARYISGDMSLSEIRRRAYENVHRMGRPRAVRNEGLLRAAAIQEGGALFSVRRIMDQLGERALMADDDTLGAVLQRRYRMSRAEANAVTAMMRNMGEIGVQMSIDAEHSDLSQRRANYAKENQSFDAIFRKLSHGLAEGLGVNSAREWGRKLAADTTAALSRFTDALFGIVRQELTASGRETVRRVMMGRGSTDDFKALSEAQEFVGKQFFGSDQIQGGLLQGTTEGRILQAFGFNVAGLEGEEGYHDYQSMIRTYNDALSGRASGATARAVEALRKDPTAQSKLLQASAAAGGDRVKLAKNLQKMGIDPTAALAYAAQEGLHLGQGGELLGDVRLSSERSFTWAHAARGMARLAAGDIMGFALDELGLRDAFDSSLGINYSGKEGAAQYFEDQLDRRSWLSGSIGERLRGFAAWSLGMGPEESDYLSAAQRRGISDALRAFQGGGDHGELLTKLERAIISEDLSDNERAAMATLVEDLRKQVSSTGSISDGDLEKLVALGARQDSPEEIANKRALAREANRLRSDFGSMASALSEVEGASGLVEKFREVSEGGNFGAIREAINAYGAMSEEERRAISDKLGGGVAAQAFRAAGMERARLIRNMEGRGRRGQYGARDAMHAYISGGISDQLDVEVDGREISSRQARWALDAALQNSGSGRRLSKVQSAALEAYKSELAAMGLSESQVEEIITTQQEVMKDGRLTTGESAKLLELGKMEVTVDGKSTTLEELNRSRAAARQEQADPMGAKRNEYLKRMAEDSAQMKVYMRLQLEKGLEGKDLEKMGQKITEALTSKAE